jgi:hypothetical protein
VLPPDATADTAAARWQEEDQGVGAFTQSLGSDELDASNLMMAIVGFIPADHPLRATIGATPTRLSAWAIAEAERRGTRT